MARVLVIGGAGFYGRKVTEQLGREHEVVIGSRRATGPASVTIDLARSETFANFAGFDLLINCSDSVNAAPDAAIAHVLEHGGTWLEMGADAPSIDRLLGVRLSPLSGAGRANCALMAQSLFVPAYWYEQGARVEASTALGPGRASARVR